MIDTFFDAPIPRPRGLELRRVNRGEAALVAGEVVACLRRMGKRYEEWLEGDLGDIEAGLVDGRYWALRMTRDGATDGYVIGYPMDVSGGRVLLLGAIGLLPGRHPWQNREEGHQFAEHLRKIARSAGCDRVRFYSKFRGWKKLAPLIGFEQTAVQYEMEA